MSIFNLTVNSCIWLCLNCYTTVWNTGARNFRWRERKWCTFGCTTVFRFLMMKSVIGNDGTWNDFNDSDFNGFKHTLLFNQHAIVSVYHRFWGDGLKTWHFGTFGILSELCNTIRHVNEVTACVDQLRAESQLISIFCLAEKATIALPKWRIA